MNINFVVRASKARKDGMSPIEMSVIIDGKRTVLALDRRCKASQWNTKTQKVRGDKDLNDYLDVIKQKCYSIQTELVKMNGAITLDDFVDAYKHGIKDKRMTLLKYFDKHNTEYSKKVDSGTVGDTSLYKYKQVRERVASYLQSIGKKDIQMADITPSFIEGFQNYCLQTLKTNTTNKQLKMLKKVIVSAFDDGLIKANPFKLVLRDEKLQYHPLSLVEIARIRDKKIENERLNNVRDLFLFQCFTGLAYADMASFTKDDIVDGMIVKRRKKTDIKSVIPLLPEAKRILEKYNYNLPVLSNQKYNAYLDELKFICDIKQKIHSHLARHTHATILINQGVELPVIARILGHSSTKVTEKIYAELLDTTVRDNADKIANAFTI